ncbi:MAG: hypothetical protein OXU35_12050 [Acidobacteriota bacterium]|nr:hypothetical protein [Acidobacteriota bacterium]
MSGRFLAKAVVIAGVLLAGRTALAQPVIQIGSAGESGGAREGWVLGAGYNFDFPVLPFEIGGLVQGGTGIETEGGDTEYPLRAFVTGRMGMLPMPGFSVYVGGGAGVATRLGGETESETVPAGMAFGGFEVGRLHLEVQFQREFHEEPVNRWVTAVGVTF